jgi:hypothetical protein
MNILLAFIFFISMACFGFTFIYFLYIIRSFSNENVNSLSLVKDINKIGNVYRKYLKIEMENNSNVKLPKLLVITNIISFFVYAGLFFVLVVYNFVNV